MTSPTRLAAASRLPRRFRMAPLAALCCSVVLWGCATLTAPFDQKALDDAVALKAQSLDLMSKATQPFAGHAPAVADLESRLNDAVTYAEGRARNQQAAKQWKTLADPNANLLGGFLSRWKTSGPLGSAFIQEARGLVGKGFDQIIELEEARRH